MASFERIDRISEEVRRTIDEILRELGDPRLKGTWSIVRCEVTRDLKYCKVRISVLEDEYREGILKALTNAAGFVRYELGKRAKLRQLPEIRFEMDNNIEYAAHIQKILNDEEKRLPKDEDE